MLLTNLHHYLAIVVFSALVRDISAQQFKGDSCTLKTGGQGTCKLLNECPKAMEELQQRFPQICGFEGTVSVVCCPEDEVKKPRRQPGVISKRKCREYSAYAFKRSVAPVLLIDAPTVETNECGHNVVTLIVGGTVAERKEFPHMAAIGYEATPGDIKWLCGGTILSNKYILTAGHCLSSYDYGDAKWAKMGVTDLLDTHHRQEIKIADRIAYPEYRSSSHYHDIGLLKLETPAKMDPFARPACLYQEKEIAAQKAIATGWGQTAWSGSSSNELRKVTIDLFDHAFCNSSYRNQISRRLKKGIVDDIQLCAGSEDQEKDTCQGDSGGPLQIYHINDDVKCMYDVIGVTSFGKACSGSPGVYVRVSNYVQWIEDHVWP